MDPGRTLDRLATETFDLVVIGAGIVGARVALEAAKAGANVALIDAGDFGGATSSASSKLIHGGLRYLQMYDFALVREAHRERRKLLDVLAPHLVRPLTFVLPVYRGGPHSVATIGGALLTYSALSGFRHSRARLVRRDAARRLVPSVNTEGLVAAGVYEDAQTHDSRLVLATVAGAAAAGAAVANHLAVSGLEIAGAGVSGVVAGAIRVRCRAVINAAGPWVDRVRRLEDPSATPVARLSKGVHLVLDRPDGWRGALTTPLEGGRVTFAVPWEGMLLLGTTDTEYEGDPAALRTEPEDVDTVLREAALALPPEVLDRDRIRFAFAGLRVLPRGDGSTARAHRDEVIQTGPAGMVSVAGGKLTTHRQTAVHVLRHLPAFSRAVLTDEPLPGAGPVPPRPLEADPDVWDQLVHLYGTDAARVAELGLERIHPQGPDVQGQVHYAAEAEWARTVGDVVRRRTTLEIRGLATAEVRDAIGATLAARGVLISSDGH